MYTVAIPADLKFRDLHQARIFAQAVDQLLNMADVRTGGVIIKNELGSLVSLIEPVVDRSKQVSGIQAATDEASRLVKEIEALTLTDDEPGDFWDALFASVAASGEVDLVEVQRLATERLHLSEPFNLLPDLVAKIAKAQAERTLRPVSKKVGR